ncbi:ribosomal protection-like ABC-F family protein [Ornithinibacillus salinisoli]|uniref:Ribosomal protection-like ABC-F family protein n=1 Tax=Ornithinibacillus salinisoli TaxID=1848459 RepID=A0ABW4VYH3_9BACI
MITCSVNQIAKMYGGNSIFEDISFEVKEGERIGLVGQNGGGKTTLLRLLAGEETPDHGQIHWKKGLGIGYLKQIPNYHKEVTTKEVLFTAFSDLLDAKDKMKKLEAEMSYEGDPEALQKLVTSYGTHQDYFTREGGYEIDSSLDKVAFGLNMTHLLEQKISTLSGGEQTKVGLALILLKNPDFLILDEPTNHLDLLAVEWLGGFLKEYRGTVLVVSHDRYFLDEVVTKILDLEDGKLECYHTNFTGFIKEKEERLLREFQAYEEQQKKIKKMKEAIKRLKDWANRANPPNEGLHKRARNMERAIERMKKLDRPVLNQKKMNLNMEATDRSGNDVVMLKEVSKSFGQQVLFTDATMQISYQQRVAVIGENGTGKSTLIKLILQELKPDEGEVRVGSNVKIGYLSQHVFVGTEEETIIEAFRKYVAVAEGEARNILARFLFYGPNVFQKVSQLSGGEKMRLRLAQLMYQDINFLVLDEPTNHLDIESREVLEEVLADYNGTILAVSHDRYFLNKLFGKIYWIDSKRIHGFDGDYSWARDNMEEMKTSQEKVSIKKSHRLQTSKRKEPRRKEPNPEVEMETVEQQIMDLECKLEAIKNVEQLQALYEEKEQLELKWEHLYEQLHG